MRPCMAEHDYAQALIRPKMHRPALANTYFPRERLLQNLIDERDRPLVLIAGPAGYGKTTLLSAWLAKVGWPAAWVSLGAEDDSVASFVRYIVTAIRDIFPDALPGASAMLQAMVLPEMPVVANTLINELDSIGQPFILALDDYHAIQSREVHDLVGRIITYPPRGFHLAIATRHDPPLPLAAARAQGRVVEIRMDGLRMTEDEAALLLRRVSGLDLSPSAVTVVADQLDGWAAGLHVAALALRQRPATLTIGPQSSVATHDILGYLLVEVLDKQPACVQEWLLRTSVLDELTAELCDAVVVPGSGTCDEHIDVESLARSGLFVSVEDSDAKVYRYHHLFQRLLHEQLLRRFGPGEASALQVRASDWYAQHNQPDRALHYALKAKDHAQAVDILKRFRFQMMNDDEWQGLEAMLAQLPRDVIDASPDALLVEAFLAHIQFRREKVTVRLDRADELIARMPPGPERDALAGESAGLRSHTHYEDLDMARCAITSDLAMRQAPHANWHARAYAWLFSAATHVLTGDRVGGLNLANASFITEEDQGLGMRLRLYMALAFIHSYVGDLASLQHTAEAGLKLGAPDDPAAKWLNHLNWLRYQLGFARYHRGDLGAAAQAFAGVVATRHRAYLNCAVQSMFGLALIHQAQGEPERASEVAELAAQHALEMRAMRLQPVTAAFKVYLEMRQGQLVSVAHGLSAWAMPEVLPPMPFLFHPHVALPQLCLAIGTPECLARADEMLARLRTHAERYHNARILIEVLASHALLAEARHEQRAAQTLLERALHLAQPAGYVQLFADLGPRMVDMLARVHSRNVSPAFIRRILDALRNRQPGQNGSKPGVLVEALTDRELEVLALLQRRMSNKEIAASLYISPGTVKRHTHSIFQKLDANSRREAVTKALERQLLDP